MCTVNKVFHGDPLHTPRGCFAQVWSVAQLLGACQLTYEAQAGAAVAIASMSL